MYMKSTYKDVEGVVKVINMIDKVFAESDKRGRYPEALLAEAGEIVSIINKDGVRVSLRSSGYTKIEDVISETVYINNERFNNKDLMNRIKDGAIYKESSRYRCITKPIFEVVVYDKDNKLMNYEHNLTEILQEKMRSEPKNGAEFLLLLLEVVEDNETIPF